MARTLTAGELRAAPYARAAATTYGVPAALLMAVASWETRGSFAPRAYNGTGGDGERGGSYGPMQMSLQTARALGYTGTPDGLFDLGVNFSLGAKYLRDLLGEAARGGYGFDAAVSSYNAGGSGYRRGDGKRNGINAAPASVAQKYPFVNQTLYVDPVMRRFGEYAALGFPIAAPAFTRAGGKMPAVAIAGGAALLMLLLLGGALLAARGAT